MDGHMTGGAVGCRGSEAAVPGRCLRMTAETEIGHALLG